MESVLTTYLNRLKEIRASGRATDERSYYPALAALLTAVGETLTPRVIALHETVDRGEGHPDFLLQVQGSGDVRAAIEVKGAGANLETIIASRQVQDYLRGYRLVLVTNLRDFALVRTGRTGQPEVIMPYTISGSEESFWTTPTRTLATQHDERFGDFLANVLTWDADITRIDVLAGALARYAREALRRMEAQPAGNLDPLKQAMSEALGMHFTGEDGEHFFRSSLVQTLFYGLFSAWVVWNQQGAPDRFWWREAGDYLSLPIVRELFERIAIGHQLDALDMRKPIEWAEALLMSRITLD